VRAIMSVEPPAGNGTIMVTGFSGHAANVDADIPSVAIAANSVERILFTPIS